MEANKSALVTANWTCGVLWIENMICTCRLEDEHSLEVHVGGTNYGEKLTFTVKRMTRMELEDL